MGKKPIVSVTYENERISVKNCLPYLKCGPRADLRPFYGFLCKRFSIYRENTNPYISNVTYATMPMFPDAHISSLDYLCLH